MVWGWGLISLALASVPTTVSIKMYPSNSIIMAYLVNQSDSASKIKPPQLRRGFMTVPRVGLEPTLPEGNWILNRVSFSLYSPYESPLASERVTHIELPTSLL